VPDDEKKTEDLPGKAPAHEEAEKAEAKGADVPDAGQAGGEQGEQGEQEASEDKGAGDRYAPDAIAARVADMGEESDVDRIARQEEEKLRERRKGKKGKKGLESAASKRLAKIGEAKVKRPSALGDVTSDADPLIERTERVRKWIQQNRQTFGALVAVALFAAAGFVGWTYWQNKKEADASALLSQGIAAEHGQVSDKEEDDDDENKRTSPLYPTFKTEADKRAAALAKYRDVESRFPGTGAAILARLAEAGILLDQGDGKGAAAAYADVKGSVLAQADTQVRGRALEGQGFADEMLARTDAGARDKHLDDALSSFKELEQIETKGFKELGKYHEARVLLAKGDREKAIGLLKDVNTAVTEPGDVHPFAYLGAVVEDRLRQLDPTALPPKAAKMPGGAGMGLPGMGGEGPGGIDMSDPRVQDLIRQIQAQQQQKGGGGGPPIVPGMPPMPGVPGAPGGPMPMPPVPQAPPVPKP
jgi:hypothetical protein